uniref:PDZ domain-containing protein n=1 Tax=Sinocyclocheilus grahami TaxID=75366 RepID=A0A672NT76_SINGR
ENGNTQNSYLTLFRAGATCLGFSVVGGRGMGSRLSDGEMRRGIFIKHIAEDRAADLDGRLLLGDQILSVNGEDILQGVTHSEAVQLLRQTSGTVTLQVLSKTPPTC